MAKKAGLSRADVVAAAALIADTDGLAALSLSAVAQRVGVRSPSLYAHVDGLPGLRRLLALQGAEVLRTALEEAVADADPADALRAAAVALRSLSVRHPGLYAASSPGVARSDDPELHRAQAAAAAPVLAAVERTGLTGPDAVHAVRAVRAAVHGFALLERDGGFAQPVDVEDSFAVLVRSVVDGVLHARHR